MSRFGEIGEKCGAVDAQNRLKTKYLGSEETAMLATRDAHSLYKETGWTPLKDPTKFMERPFPDVYKTRS